MNLLYSSLCIILGISFILWNRRSKNNNDNSWDIVMSWRLLIGGILFIIIGLVTLVKGW